MAIEEVINSSISPEDLFPLVSRALSPLINLAKILGVVFIIYIIYVIIKGIMNYNRNKKIEVTYKKVLEIDRKLDELLKHKKEKPKKQEKKKK